MMEAAVCRYIVGAAVSSGREGSGGHGPAGAVFPGQEGRRAAGQR
jgi:hypothetical protein